MALTLESVTVDAADPARIADFWQQVLGWDRRVDSADEVAVVPQSGGAELLFVRVDDGKQVKNRLHLDLRPDDQDAEVARALALGATRADIGQTGAESWVVLADPDGNEFCVLSTRAD